MADEWGDERGEAGTGNGSANGPVGTTETLYDRRLSGQKNPPDPEAIAAAVRRDPHIQQITQQDHAARRFSTAQFVGHVSEKMTFNKNGDLVIQVLVPYEFKQFALPLADAFGIPLSFDVQIWKPYTEAEAE